MATIKQIIRIGLHLLLKCNTIKTLYVNFKMLPISDAIRLPIWIYGKMTFRSLKGKILIDADVYPGMIRVGRTDWYVSTMPAQTIWTINGTLKFKGRLNIYYGGYICVSRNGYLELGTNGTLIGSNCKIICFDRIIVGNDVRITWECQLIDTSFHYVEMLSDNTTSPLTKAITIEDNSWIGNRSTISKGTYLPRYSIVASNSVVNKDFSQEGPFSMFAGTPAKFKLKCRRIFDRDIEKELDAKYNYDRTHL